MNLQGNNIPEHVAIIMDGNGRWAKRRDKLRIFGHRNGVNSVRRAVSYAGKVGIKILTLYAFSSENWKRPKNEVGALMTLFMQTLDSEISKLNENSIRLKILGDTTHFATSLQNQIKFSEKLTENNTGLILNIAANYGGHWDILQATKKICQQVKSNQLEINDITEQVFQQNLATEQHSKVDLLIRTSGEQRISNFLLWQIAYAELFFSNTLWPDFDESEFEKALISYQQRERRFGS